jgi:hypothetical protein
MKRRFMILTRPSALIRNLRAPRKTAIWAAQHKEQLEGAVYSYGNYAWLCVSGLTKVTPVNHLPAVSS